MHYYENHLHDLVNYIDFGGTFRLFFLILFILIFFQCCKGLQDPYGQAEDSSTQLLRSKTKSSSQKIIRYPSRHLPISSNISNMQRAVEYYQH